MTPCSISTKRRLIWLVMLTLLAAGIRTYQLDDVPLRGDEAFTVRFWAQPPAQTWHDLAHWEPHPMGAFVLFWGWKSLVGEGEFAMRTLPALVNLLGVPLMIVLARRFSLSEHGIIIAGLAWALNPFLAWHAQDVRNYAPWAAVSLLAVWRFWRALESDSRRDWALYALAEIAACYLFFLEPFFALIHGLILLLFAPSRWRRAMAAWAVVGVALIPWMIQAVRLAGSDYAGTAAGTSLTVLAQDFLPAFLFGEGQSLGLVWGASLLIVLGAALMVSTPRREGLLLLAWLFIPIILLCLAGTRLDVFRPRYIIPSVAPLLLALLWLAHRLARIGGLMRMALMVGLGVGLYAYFTGPPKAPDWPATARFLEKRTRAGDLIVLANTDPAFDYYYHGPALSLPWSEIPSVESALAFGGVYVQQGDSTFALSQGLQDSSQFIPPAISLLKHYRSYAAAPSEIENPLDVTLGDVARLRGYTLLGGDEFGLTVLIYWEPLRRTEREYVGYIHAIQPNRPGLVAQDDHAPLNNLAPTTAWNVGDLLRDVFYLPLGTGRYQLLIGMYEFGTNNPLPVIGDGQTLGETWLLAEVEIE